MNTHFNKEEIELIKKWFKIITSLKDSLLEEKDRELDRKIRSMSYLNGDWTTRDRFALEAMKFDIAVAIAKGDTICHPPAAAKFAYEMADAMMQAKKDADELLQRD